MSVYGLRREKCVSVAFMSSAFTTFAPDLRIVEAHKLTSRNAGS